MDDCDVLVLMALSLLGGFSKLVGIEGNKKVPRNNKKKGPIRYIALL